MRLSICVPWSIRRTLNGTLDTRLGEAIESVGPWCSIVLADRLDEDARCRDADSVLGAAPLNLCTARSLGMRASARSDDEATDDDESMVVDE